jgi:hypothetical protein
VLRATRHGRYISIHFKLETMRNTAWALVLMWLATLGACGGARGPWGAGTVTALVTDDSAVFVMPSGWHGAPPEPSRGVTSRIDFGWSVLVPSAEGYSISSWRFDRDTSGATGTPLERLIAPSLTCLCDQTAGGHAHDAHRPPRVPREVTLRARGDHVVLTLKAAPAVRAVFGSRPTHVWFKRWLPWPRADSMRVAVRYTAPGLPAAAGEHHERIDR